jgi:hypothetical protein
VLLLLLLLLLVRAATAGTSGSLTDKRGAAFVARCFCARVQDGK